MKWSALSKEKRERLILKTLLALIALVALYFYGITPLFTRIRASREELDKLERKLESVTRLARRRETLQTGLQGNVATLRELFTQFVPPEDNAFLWATEHIYRFARDYRVNIEGITEVRQPVPVWAQRSAAPPPAPTEGEGGAKARQEPGRRFAPYAVQVRARCAFPDLLRMLEAMENANPYVSMAGISVLADDAWPRQQSARVTIEWPRHVGPLDKALQDVLPQAVDAGRKAP